MKSRAWDKINGLSTGNSMAWDRRIIQLLGGESWVTRGLQRIRGSVLRAVYGSRGMPRKVNGVPVRVGPEHRWYFAPQYDVSVADYFRPRVAAWICLSERRCESRGVPCAVRPLVGPEWRRAMRSSPTRTLRQPSADTSP